MNSINQWSQDQWVLATLNNLRGGFFLDSGASDGVGGSNTLLLEKDYGWTGICVEPVPRQFDALVNNRQCRFFKGALDSKTGTSTLVVPDYCSDLAGLHDKLGGDMWHSIREAPTNQRIEVATISPADLLDTFQAPPVIDYWSLDTEGSELYILEVFPWDRYKVRAMTVEHNEVIAHRDMIRQLCASVGMVHAGGTQYEDYFTDL